MPLAPSPLLVATCWWWRWSGPGPPDRHHPPPRYPTRVRISLYLPLCPLLYEHNLFTEEADSLLFLRPTQHRFHDRRGGQSLAYNETQGVAGQLPRRTTLQRVLRRVPALLAVATDICHLSSDLQQDLQLAEHAVSREYLGHPVGQRETADAPPCFPTWEDRLHAWMFGSLVDQLRPPLVPCILLGGSQIV